MTRALLVGSLLALALAPPAFAQTHLTFAGGAGGAQGAFGDSDTFDARAVGAEFHLNPRWWIGAEVGLISGTGRGFASSDGVLAIPINLYGYGPTWRCVTPFGTFGYTSIDVLGIGFDAGAGLDLRLSTYVALRTEVRGLLVHDKSGMDRFGMWRVGAVIGLGR